MILFPAIWWLFPVASLLLIGFSLYLARAGGQERVILRRGFVVSGAALGLLALVLPFFAQPTFQHPLINYPLGLPLSVLGLVGRIYPMAYLQRQGTTTTLESVTKLVDTGPYGWVRHPQYTAGFLLLCGWYLIWGASSSLAMLPLLAGIVYAQAWIEETSILEPQFGSAYAAYRERTGMLIPRMANVWSPLRFTVAFLGAYAGILGMQHGSFALLQGATAPAGVRFNAIGPPCRPEMVWHACFPAMTLIPNLRITGVAAIIVGLLLLLWALLFAQRRYGGWALGVLAVLLLLVGGGFVPVFIGLVAAAASHGLHRPGAWPRFAAMARAWPWPLVLMALWLPGSWLLGHFAGAAMLAASGLLFLVFDIGLPVLAVCSGLGRAPQEKEWL
jgi:protein-S-isoprenylcysteine O-methyltransferase Ste14